jgi:hypothetical protein
MKKQDWVIGGLALMAGAAAAQTNEVTLPGAAPDIIDWLLGSRVVSIAKYAAIITMVVQIVKTAAVLFGGKLPPKVTAGVVALVGLLTLWESATADGQINGGDWSALIVSLAATVCAFFGYKLLFSAKSAVNLD